MKEWNLFLICIGAIFIMMSYLMENPLLLIVSGIVVAGYGFYRIKQSK